jgi:hypothetical protein
MLRIPSLAAAGAAAPSPSHKPARKSASSISRSRIDAAAENAAAKLRRGSTGEAEKAGAVSSGLLGPNVVAKTWQQQVERITAPEGSVAPSLRGKEGRFRSMAVYCEVRGSRSRGLPGLACCLRGQRMLGVVSCHNIFGATSWQSNGHENIVASDPAKKAAQTTTRHKDMQSRQARLQLKEFWRTYPHLKIETTSRSAYCQ